MINNVNSQQNFTSAFIPKSNKAVSTYTDALTKYFELKGFGKISNEAARDKISLNQAAVTLSDGGLTILGKDKSADNFIGKMLKLVDNNIKYVDDAPEFKSDMPTFKLLG